MVCHDWGFSWAVKTGSEIDLHQLFKQKLHVAQGIQVSEKVWTMSPLSYLATKRILFVQTQNWKISSVPLWKIEIHLTNFIFTYLFRRPYLQVQVHSGFLKVGTSTYGFWGNTTQTIAMLNFSLYCGGTVEALPIRPNISFWWWMDYITFQSWYFLANL